MLTSSAVNNAMVGSEHELEEFRSRPGDDALLDRQSVPDTAISQSNKGYQRTKTQMSTRTTFAIFAPTQRPCRVHID